MLESYNLVGLYFIEGEMNLTRCSRKSLTTLQAMKFESEQCSFKHTKLCLTSFKILRVQIKTIYFLTSYFYKVKK